MDYPGNKECYELIRQYGLPREILQHSEKVKEICLLLGRELKKTGQNVDLGLLESAALLHDLFKPCDYDDKKYCLRVRELAGGVKGLERMKHAGMFYQVFKEKYPVLAKVVLNHRYMAIKTGLDSWEEKLLYYADKRVKFDEIVSLKERLDDLHSRYQDREKQSGFSEYVKEIDAMIFELEKEIFKYIPFKPNDVKKLING